MKTFPCQQCGQTLFFENVLCTQCGSEQAFVPPLSALCVVNASSPEPGQAAEFTAPDGGKYRHCTNRIQYTACNWAVPVEREGDGRCDACLLNEVVPNLNDPENLASWKRLEAAKRRLLWTLSRFPLAYTAEGDVPGLSFRFLADKPDKPKVLTGHASGVITINIQEADPATREATRMEMGERYRTTIGHFRHESGHFFWERLISPNPERLQAFRQLFGDERADYQTALQQHYEAHKAGVTPPGFISSYASSHPWEDWAESWAHYLHMVDTLETAKEHGLVPEAQAMFTSASFDSMLEAWQKLSVTLNSLSRSMGTPDPYPFAPGPQELAKVRFVHETVANEVASSPAAAAS